MTSIFSGAGYFMNDDRASGGKLTEDDILSCAHRIECSGAMKRSQWKLHGGMCLKCNQPLCGKCYERAKRFGCEGPEEKRIEQAVNDMIRRQQNAKVLGI
jgi:hypothetical protein